MLGSFLPLIILSCSHFSFLTAGNCVTTSLAEAWVGLISHHGQSVSIISLSDGIVVTTKRFSSVLRELNKKSKRFKNYKKEQQFFVNKSKENH